jgi:hypothetical protein
MKKFLLLACLACVFHAQAQQADSSGIAVDLDYYMLKNNSLIHYLATGEAETVLDNATLSNGTVVTAAGKMLTKSGTKSQLVNGECIDAAGALKSCEVLDARVKKKLEEKDNKK